MTTVQHCVSHKP